MVSDGKYKFSSHGCCIKACFIVDDFTEDIENANASLVHKEQIVAIAHYRKSNEVKYVRMMKVSKKTDTNFSTVATLEDLNEEEANEVQKFIERRKRWL